MEHERPTVTKTEALAPPPVSGSLIAGLRAALVGFALFVVLRWTLGFAAVTCSISVVLGAVALQHIGGVNAGTFAVGLWGGMIVVGIAAILAVRAWILRRAVRAGRSRTGWLSRHPLLVLGAVLTVGAIVFGRRAWDRGDALSPDKLGALFVLSLMLFVACFGTATLFKWGFAFVRAVDRWSLRSPWRAGFATAILALLTANVLTGVAAPPTIAADRVAERIEEVADEAALEPNGTDVLRHLLAAVAEAWDPPTPPAPRVAGRLPPTAARTFDTRTADDPSASRLGFHGCLSRLREMRSLDGDREEVVRRFGLSHFDADDAIAEAMLRTCLNIARIRRNLGGYYWTAVQSQALRQYERWKVCKPVEEIPDSPGGDEQCRIGESEDVRDERRLAAIDTEQCRLGPDSARIVDLHISHDRSFAEIAAELRITREQARNGYYDAIKKIRKRLKETGCFNDL